MSTTILYHTQGIRDFKHVGYRFHDGIVEQVLKGRSTGALFAGATMYRLTSAGRALLPDCPSEARVFG